MSLLAVTALVAGIVFARARHPGTPEVVEQDQVHRPTISLEELRQAGF